MPEQKTLKKARQAKREGKAPSTQAGAFVEEEIEHIREGKHGARSAKQAIAIGLSKARRAGVALPPPKSASERTKGSARSAKARAGTRPSSSRSRAAKAALEDESKSAASPKALSRQATAAAKRRPARARKAAARRASRTRAANKRR
jgi:hypothetical protein